MDNPITTRRQPIEQGPRGERQRALPALVDSTSEQVNRLARKMDGFKGPDAGSYEGMKTYDEVD